MISTAFTPAWTASRGCPDPRWERGNPGPDDTDDPDFPQRRDNGGPDDTSDPDFPDRRDDGGFSGPDGYYPGPLFIHK
ncbi:MAG: hypothetical protein FJX76_24155 [Armatimonadetes bacterium]|nr:hypothetical protein [Armatimonadota bacterium]